jgi:xanthine/CO dehydrogenase XdhC/CoxF family maturation factor
VIDNAVHAGRLRIGARRGDNLVVDFLREQGIPDADLAWIRAPAGLDFDARTPGEIALFLISEITMLRRDASGRPMHGLLGQQVERQDRASASTREIVEAS